MSYQDIIDEALEEKEHIKSGKFVPSLFGSCFRRQYWSRADEPVTNPFDKRTLRVFKCGNIFEQFFTDLYLKKNPKAKYQVKIETEDVLGYCDVDNPAEDEVMDVKSQHSKAFWYMTKHCEDIRQSKYGNWMQVMYYAWKLGRKKGCLVYISKDDLCIQEYHQNFEDGYWLGELAKELKTLGDHWVKKELPEAQPRLYPQKDGSFKECEYCVWKDKCKKEEE